MSIALEHPKQSTIISHILFSNEVQAAIAAYLPEGTTAYEEYLAILSFELLEDLIRGSVKENNTSIAIISDLSINPITAWYIDTAYTDLEETLRGLSQVHSANPARKKKIVDSLALLGIFFGKLDKDNPHARYYQELLAPHLSDTVPQLVKEYIPLQDSANLTSPRLRNLQGYWQQAFILKWVAAARVENDGMGALSAADRARASAKLPTDNRAADTHTGAKKNAAYLEARLGSAVSASGVVTEHAQETHKLRQAEIAAQLQLQEYTHQLILAYNPSHKGLVDEAGRAIGKWAYFKQKNPKFFEIFVRFAHPLAKRGRPPGDIETTIAQTAVTLRAALKHGKGDFELSETELFGTDFPNLSPLEQTSLIIFTALTLVESRDRPNLAVNLISNTLQRLLANHTDKVPNSKPPFEKAPHFDLAKYEKAATEAKTTKVRELKPEGGVVTVVDPLITSKLAQLYALSKDIQALTEFNPSRGVEIVKTVTGSISNLLMLYAGFMTGVLSYQFFDSESSEPYQSIKLIVSIFATVAYFGFREVLGGGKFSSIRGHGRKAVRAETKLIEILGENFIEAIHKVSELRESKQRLSRAVLIAMMLTVFSLGFGSKAVNELDLFGEEPESSFGIGNEGQVGAPRIPESINPESLRAIEPRYEGQILQLPEDFTGNLDGIVGYQPTRWQTLNGSLYRSDHVLPFRNTEIVSNLEERDYQPQPQELIYQLGYLNGNLPIYPWEGYVITRIIQVGGAQPVQGNMGEISYASGDALPTDIIVISEKISDAINLDSQGHVQFYPGVFPGSEYDPWNDWESKKEVSLTVNYQLEGDHDLQQLHLQMILDADQLFQSYQNGNIDHDTLRGMWSNLATRYAISFAEYVDTHRYYSLQFDPSGENSGLFGTLESVADAPEEGYYCTVGNLTFQQFMEGIDINVITQSGVHLHNFDGDLYSKIGHMDSRMPLPNGQVLDTDMTPSRPMPGEDLSVLNEPFQLGSARKREVLKKILNTLGVALAGATLYVGSKEIKKKLRKKTFEEKLTGTLPKDENEAAGILRALEHIVVYVTDTADQKSWEKFAPAGGGHPYKDRAGLYEALASDALGALTNDRLEDWTNLRSYLTGEIEVLNKKPKPIYEELHKVEYKKLHAYPITVRKQIRDGLKMVRRHLVVEARKREDALAQEQKNLESLILALNTQQEGVDQKIEEFRDHQGPALIQLKNDYWRLQIKVDLLQKEIALCEKKMSSLNNVGILSRALEIILQETR